MGGLGIAAASLVLPTEKLWPYAEKCAIKLYGKLAANRAELHEIMCKILENQELGVFARQEALRIIGQNATQTLLNEPLSPELLKAFPEYIYMIHDARHLTWGGQAKTSSTLHQRHPAPSLLEAVMANPHSGHISGALPHVIGAGYDAMRGVAYGGLDIALGAARYMTPGGPTRSAVRDERRRDKDKTRQFNDELLRGLLEKDKSGRLSRSMI